MENVADLYRLTPVQSGMLFHTLAAPGSGVYVLQYTCEIVGELEEVAFRSAWDRVVARHSLLRTAFLWEGLDEPLQVVRETVTLPWLSLDWRERPERSIGQELDEFLQADRLRGFAIDEAPLLRVALIRTGEDRRRLIWTFHHILQDGWSTTVLIREVLSAYHSIVDGRAVDLPAAPPFRDYVGWMESRDLDGPKRFWQEFLSGPDGATSLGIERAERETSIGGQDVPRRIREQAEITASRALTADLNAFAREQRVTLNTVIHGAWAILMSRYSGDSVVQYGTTVSVRPAEVDGIEQMVGPLINTLPMRVPVPPDAQLSTWLMELRDQLLGSWSRQHTPLPAIAEWTGKTSQELFGQILVFENYPVEGTDPAKEAEPRLQGVEYLDQSNYPMAMLVVPGDQLRLIAIYDPTIYPGAAVDRFLRDLESTLAACVEDREGRLSDLAPPLGEARRKLLEEWSGARVPPPHGKTGFLEAFAAWATEQPSAVAADASSGYLSYGELDRQSALLAERLCTAGVGPGNVVALSAERSMALLVGIVGILRSGAAYVPLDPSYPTARKRFLLRDAGARHLVTTPTEVERLEEIGKDALNEILILDESLSVSVRGERAGTVPSNAMPPGMDDLAYVIYTSGSTGEPKGVEVTHGNLAFSTMARDGVYAERPERFLLLSPFTFDSSVVGIFWPLCSGGAVVLPPPGHERDPEAIVQLIRRRSVTHLLCVPSLYGFILEAAAAGDLDSLKTVIVAGEACPPRLARHHQSSLPQVALFNEYGPTEGTVWSTAYEVPPGFEGDFVSIGRPIPGTRVYLLDPADRPVPVGVAGEIHIAGPGVARGYLGRPELTATRFGPDSFRSNGRMYATGDLARWTEDGTLEFLGRVDHQVKVRGRRVELGEIEAALLRHESVVETVATFGPLGRGAEDGDDRVHLEATVIAYVVFREGASPAEDMLRAYLKKELPDHMVPSSFVTMESLPRSDRGKVDRSALPRPERPRPEERSGFVAPRSEDEVLLARIWADVLGVESVGMHDSFFDMGGHSLLAIRLLGQVRETFDVRLSMDALFDAPTVAGTLQHLETLRWLAAAGAQDASGVGGEEEVEL